MMAGVVLAFLVAAAAVPAAVSGDDPCAASGDERAPDPRCGERLDGREPAEASTARQVARATKGVPRQGTRAALGPIVKTTDMLE